MKIIEIGSIAVADIVVPPRLRDVDMAWVAVIAETIKAKGQMQEIVLCMKDGKPNLLAGAHRLEAVKMAGLTDIRGMIVALDDGEEAVELEAIENMARRELTALDKAIHLGALRDIHQKRSPASTRGGDKKSKAFAEDKDKVQILYFDQAVASTVKLSRASIYAYLGIYDKLPKATRDRVKGAAMADNLSELKALANEKPADQLAILDLLQGESPKAATVSAAAALHHNEVDTSTPDERDFARFVKLWGRASKRLRKQISTHIAKHPDGEEG